MGPYCVYCNQRCFAYVPVERVTEEQAREYCERGITIIATCREGQAHEREMLGFAYGDLMQQEESANA